MGYIENLWSQLPGHQDYEEIFKLLLSETDEIRSKNSLDQLKKFFQSNLTENPRPTWEILHFLIKEKISDLECRKMFIEIAIDSLKESVINERVDEAAIFKVLDSTVLVPILTQSELKLLQNYKKIKEDIYFNSVSDWRTIFNKDEMTEICGFLNDKNLKLLKTFRDYMRLLRLVMRIEKLSDLINDMSWWIELDEISENSCSEVYCVAFSEMKRKREILKFLRKYSHHNQSSTILILTSHEIVQHLIGSNFKISMENYNDLNTLLAMNETLMKKQDPSLIFDSEYDKLNEYLINKLYADLIKSSNPSQEFVDQQANEILKCLKLITDSEILLNTFYNVLNMMMTHLHHDQFGRTKFMRYASSTDNAHELNRMSLTNNFVSSEKSLKEILNSMRIFLMSFDQSDIYKMCNRDMKSKFDEIFKYVDNFLWIVTVEKARSKFKFGTVSYQSYSAFLESENIHRTQYSSSENEIMGQKRKMLTRKKLRKRNKKSSLKISSDSDDESSPEVSARLSKVDLDGRVHSKENCILPQLTMEPEKLLSFCDVKCDYVNAERIIKDFDLKESRLAKQFKYLMNFKKVRDDLLKISKEFGGCSENFRDKKLSSSSSFTDAIKIITEKGKIRLKFFQTLENFMYTNKLNIIGHFERKSSQELTEATNSLNAAVVVILFLSIPCNYELTYDFFKFILKTFKNDEWKCRVFLIDLMEILTICSNEDIETNVVEILRTETFILDPESFKREIVLRKRLIEIWNEKQMVNVIEKIQISAKLFEQLECRETLVARNLVNYVRHLKSIVKQVSGDELKFENIVKVDPHDLLGKILFDLQYNPKMIDNLVNNSHMELLEYSAVVSERLCEKSFAEDEKLLTLFQLKEFSGGSTAIELNLDVENSRIFDIHRLDILYYLKTRNFFETKNIINLSTLYDGNRVLTALSFDHIDIKLLLRKMLESETINDKLKLLCSLSKQQWLKNENQFDEIHDSYLEMLIDSSSNFETKLEHLQKIRGIRKFYGNFMRFINDIEDENLVTKLLYKCSECSDNLETHQLEIIEEWIAKVKVYKEISQIIGKSSSWMSQMKEAEMNPYPIIHRLLILNEKFSLCSEFIKVCKIDIRHENFKKIWIDAVNIQEPNQSLILLIDVLESCSSEVVAELMVDCLSSIENVHLLLEIIKYLEIHVKHLSSDRKIFYQKFKISSRMCELMNNCESYFHLCAHPLLIIEQMLMNLNKIELKKLINEVRKVLCVDDYCFACDKSCNEMYQVRETITCDLDAFHNDMIITNECIDLMLKCYATKAIDFEIIETPSSNGTSTIESTHSNYQMPQEIPAKHAWIPDCEAKICMCCRKQRFHLFSRRHHCRRCGRVVCDSCSKYRVQLTEVYHDLFVRVCVDCNLWMLMKHDDETPMNACTETPLKNKDNLWRLTAIDATDQMIRDEFSYDDSPSIALCLDIMDLHTHNDEIAKFLIFHCYRLELLLRPISGRISPEVDIIMVTQMMKDLALAAKVHGNHGEANLIIEHSDVIRKVVEYGCEDIVPSIPLEKINSVTMRSIINDLIKSENWEVALELSVKFDNSGKIGVFSAWGVSALKLFKYRLAREKIALALKPVVGSSQELDAKFFRMLSQNEKPNKIFCYRRPNRGSPLLTEILEALEKTARKSKFDDPQFIEETIGVDLDLDTSVDVIINKNMIEDEWEVNQIIDSPYYEESMYYLIMYGGNADVLSFLMKNNLIPSALRFVQSENISPELFIQHIFVPLMKLDKMNGFIRYVRKLDPRFLTWKNYLIATCKYLERKKAFNSLYKLQINLGDRVRAALTCIDFYCEGAKNYSELHSKAFHLNDAKLHLLTELENVEWMRGNHEKTGKDELILKWDLKTINSTINIISLQLETAKYLSNCESNNFPTVDMMEKIFNEKRIVRTLFGKSQERNQVAILLLVCGKSIETGYGLAYRIIQECSLKASKVYSICIKFLARTIDRLKDIEKLVESIKENSSNDENDTMKLCDDLISMSVEIAYEIFHNQAKTQIDHLIKLISSDNMKIECYIISNQLKTAYMKSAVINNQDYICKIMRKAEATRQENIRRLCEKKLRMEVDSVSQFSKSDTQ